MLEFDDADLLQFRVNGNSVPLVQMTSVGEPPSADIRVGTQAYHYDSSYPVKGHSAILPKYLNGQLAEGKRPLLIERTDRFYVYLAV